MKQKLLLFLVFLLAGVGFYFNFQKKSKILEERFENKRVEESNNIDSSKTVSKKIIVKPTVSKKDSEVLKKAIKVKEKKENTWGMLNDYSLSPLEFLSESKASKKELGEFLRKTTTDLNECIERDYCGLEKDDEDPYFDNERTPAHITIIRILEVVKAGYESDIDLVFSNDDLFNLLESNSEEIQRHSIDLIIGKMGEKKAIEGLLNKTDKLQGDSLSHYYHKLLNIVEGSSRRDIIESLRNSFEEKDPFSTIATLEKIHTMSFSESEVDELMIGLCHFRKKNDHNWRAIKSLMSRHVKAQSWENTCH